MDFPLHLPSQLREHLRALRKERGLTQAALGRLLGVGQARIAEIESNPGVVSVEQLMKLLSALGATLVLQAGDARAAGGAASGQPLTRPDARVLREADPASGQNLVIHPRKGSW